MLVEYGKAGAHRISFKFADKVQSKKFAKFAKKHNALAAMRELGLNSEAMRVVMNSITMAIVSDCAHHVYEALRCLEKRKVVVGLNLLRKPLLESLTYLSWIVADEGDFYSAFASGDPGKIRPKIVGNRRREIFEKAISETELKGIVTADEIVSTVFDPADEGGLYLFLQHAVHLVTVERIEIRTSPENFNFIFKDPNDDDVYDALYASLPLILLYMAQLILVLYERIKPMDAGAKKSFVYRSITGFSYLHDGGADELADVMEKNLSSRLKCGACEAPLKVTRYNALRLLLTDSFRCTRCRRKQLFAFSWIF